jgi:type II secretory pathway pseudopilin PulG
MTSTSRRGRRGFTLVETLAAMLFMAIVIPVAVRGVLLANRAGVVAERTRVASQLADTLLTETIVAELWRDGSQEGDFEEEWPGYRWVLDTEAWDEDSMRVVRVEILFDVQDREYSVRLSTLAAEEQEEAESNE